MLGRSASCPRIAVIPVLSGTAESIRTLCPTHVLRAGTCAIKSVGHALEGFPKYRSQLQPGFSRQAHETKLSRKLSLSSEQSEAQPAGSRDSMFQTPPQSLSFVRISRELVNPRLFVMSLLGLSGDVTRDGTAS